MLDTPQAPVLDLRGQNVTSTLDLRDTFHQLHLCPKEHETQGQWSTKERNPQNPKGPTKQLSDTDTSDEEQINPALKTSEEE